MNFFKKIMTNGVFNTMIDENVSVRGRRTAWVVVTTLFLLAIIAEILLIFVYDIVIWRVMIIFFLSVTVIALLSLYIRLWHHIVKRRRNRKKEEIEKKLRVKAQIKAETSTNTENVYKTEKL